MWEMGERIEKEPYKDFKKCGRIFSNLGPEAKMMDHCTDSGLRFVIG